MVMIGVPSKKVLIITPTYNLELDASVTEIHNRTADVTMFPVEDGSTLTDHIVYQPIEIEMQAIISNTQLAFLGVQTPSVPSGDPRFRGENAFDALDQLMKTGTTCGIVTTLAEYSNMALVSLSTPRDALRGNMAELNMAWRKIMFAETIAVATSEPVAPQQQKKKTLGKKQPKKVDSQTAAKQERKSLLFKGFN